MELSEVLIVFPEEYLSYAPTIKNLSKCLYADGYKVTIVCFSSNKFSQCAIEAKVDYINISAIPNRLRHRGFVKYVILLFHLNKYRNNRYRAVIGVDGAGYLAAKSFFPYVVMLSLELSDVKLLSKCNKIGIDRLLIQSHRRAQYIIQENDVPVGIIHNSPFYLENLNLSESINELRKNKLVYFGSINKIFGVEEAIESLYYLDDIYTLELHGIVDSKYVGELEKRYSSLIKNHRLNMSCEYIEEEKIIDFLLKYGIGLCTYTSDLVKSSFDFESCPSGKLYNYYNAGIPVVGTDILGLSSVRSGQAGILLANPSGKSIAEAIKQIGENYEFYSKNARKNAKKYDFKESYRKIRKEIL